VAVISGGARGMGASHARTLAAEGARVLIGDLLDDDGKALADEIGELARYVHLDVRQPELWEAATATAVDEFGRLDVLVNNAGVYPRVPFLEMRESDWISCSTST
jgi:3alpha(or 20beta)-hydroxysteroid dehydrogenase